MTATTALEVRDLTVTYGSFTAVDRASIEVGGGEIYGLLGPNGAGKTSVIRALTTIVPIARGAASIAGHSIAEPASVRSGIGVLPESNGYPSSQTARSYLRFYGQLFGLGGNQGRISTFSRGMRQRLGLARALINRPAVLFLDEPTLGLDPAGQEEIMAHLTRTAVEDGTCVILCSHLLDEVERVCDRVGIMNESKIVTQGTVDEVIAASGVLGYGRIRVSADAVGATDAHLRRSCDDRVMAGELIEIERSNTVWRFEREFLESNWGCLFGNGCQGILAEPATELNQGCCSLGAHLGDGPAGEDEAMTVAAYASALTADQWQFHDLAHTDAVGRGVIGIFRDDERTHTRVVEGACVFLNRPGFAGGEGCALHIAAIEDDESPTEWKPSVCWQLPLRVDWQEIDADVESATVRRWTRGDWGEHGTTMAWCCTERADGGEAYSGAERVIDSLADELIALAGEEVYVELRRRLDTD